MDELLLRGWCSRHCLREVAHVVPGRSSVPFLQRVVWAVAVQPASRFAACCICRHHCSYGSVPQGYHPLRYQVCHGRCKGELIKVYVLWTTNGSPCFRWMNYVIFVKIMMPISRGRSIGGRTVTHKIILLLLVRLHLSQHKSHDSNSCICGVDPLCAYRCNTTEMYVSDQRANYVARLIATVQDWDILEALYSVCGFSLRGQERTRP